MGVRLDSLYLMELYARIPAHSQDPVMTSFSQGCHSNVLLGHLIVPIKSVVFI